MSQKQQHVRKKRLLTAAAVKSWRIIIRIMQTESVRAAQSDSPSKGDIGCHLLGAPLKPDK